MKKYFAYIIHHSKIAIVIGGTIFAFIQLLDYFGLKKFSNGFIGLIALISISVICTFIHILIQRKPNDEQKRINELNERITNRIGVLKSSEKPTEDIVDNTHQIYLFERVDILDYETNDYMSYRIIKGKNATKSTSAFLKYKESTDSKTSNSELTIMAYDIKTKKKLSVQFDTNDKVYTHNFKISFLKPLAPNENLK